METQFTLAQLADPDTAAAEQVLRTCVHCGFCTATCPTYVLLGDELDSPRGRIYLIKDMLENGGKQPTERHVRHIDRCLSCLSCMTTCPSGVHYMHLIDHARTYIEHHYDRPLVDRALRALLAFVLPSPFRFRVALLAAAPLRGLGRWLPARLAALMSLAPARVPAPSAIDRPQVVPAMGAKRGRVALLSGCAQQVLNPGINEAAVRLLTRLGVEVVIAEGAGCCGALAHHMGQHVSALDRVKANVAAWQREIQAGGLDAILVAASGCGTTIKDYGWMLREDPIWAGPAAQVAALARDVTEYLDRIGLPSGAGVADAPTVAYHSACSMQHGQKIKSEPKRLLASAGFKVVEPAEAHLCCGSAGTYNLLQPEIAVQLRDRKAGHLTATGADLIATGNIGCMTQLAGALEQPVVHTVELLDWATGGPRPATLLHE
jgi:glycolate oxidase iron-sulfur subunit